MAASSTSPKSRSKAVIAPKESVAKKTVAKKAAPKKPVTKVSLIKTPTPKKLKAKKPAEKPLAVKKKTVAKTPATKTPAAKTVVAKKVAPKTTPLKKAATKTSAVKKPVVKKTIAKKPALKTLTSKKAVTKKPIAKKTVAQKPIAQKPIAKPLASNKTVAPKTPVKKPIGKKPAVKTPVRVQNLAAKTTPSKTALSKKASIQNQLINLEARLKRANTTTRKNVKTLEQLVTSLESKSKTAQSTQKAAFTRKVDALNKKLTSLMEASQADIVKDLSTAAGTSSLSDLEAALSRADERLARTEISQADAITKVNRHVANLATALEARFEDEKAATTAAISASEEKSEAKIDGLEKAVQDNAITLTRKVEALETDTSAALETLGGQIENFAAELDNRQSRSDTNMGEKVSEIALQTQAEFETFRSDIDARMADLSSRTLANNTSVPANSQGEGQLNVLQDRLESLEQYIAGMNTQAPSATFAIPSAQLAPPLPTSTNVPVQTNIPAPVSAPAPTNVVPITDAFAPANPYSVAPPAEVVETPAAESHIPVEFDPSAYQTANAAAPAPQMPAPQMPAPGLSQATPPMAAHEYNAPNMPDFLELTNTPDFNGLDFNESADYPPLNEPQDAIVAAPSALNMDTESVETTLPYADPAYAENSHDDSLRAERIGEPVKASKKKLKQLKLGQTNGKSGGSSPLRFLLAGSAIALLLVFAGKMVLGGGNEYAPVPDKTVQVEKSASSPFNTETFNTGAFNTDALNTGAQDTNAAKVEGSNLDFTLGQDKQAPIGKYAENVTPVFSQSGKSTLQSASDNGNPVAQYQLGISHLEAGELAPAVKLIRASAAQDLAPAQYRLAKLYEVGHGVTKDEAQARQLTERAAKSGHRIAMHDLALYYADGRGGVEANVDIAQSWFEKAAQHGVVDSQFNLAVLAESRTPPNRDVDTAYFWYNIAAKQGDQVAQDRVKIVGQGLSPEQIDAADARIAAFTPRPVNPETNGVFRDVPWAAPVKVVNTVKIEQIRQAQSYLAELGYEVGAADGAMGPNTRSAITEFEKVNSLPETGKVDEALIDQLEQAVGA